jgi:hypothetical protein
MTDLKKELWLQNWAIIILIILVFIVLTAEHVVMLAPVSNTYNIDQSQILHHLEAIKRYSNQITEINGDQTDFKTVWRSQEVCSHIDSILAIYKEGMR